MSTPPAGSPGKLFRAVVVMGAALTTPACGDNAPKVDASIATDGKVADATPIDAPKADAAPSDATADAVVIL